MTHPSRTGPRSLQDVAADPQRGDKVRNRRAAHDHQTRLVIDRTLGGDVWYCFNERSKWKAVCSLDQWKEFCGEGAKLYATA